MDEKQARAGIEAIDRGALAESSRTDLLDVRRLSESARLLVERGADPYATDPQGRTSFDLGNDIVAQVLRSHGS